MERPGYPSRALWALALGLAGLGLATGLAHAQGAGRALPPSPVVVDAAGRIVGMVNGFGVQVRVGERVAVIGVGRNQFFGGAASAVFESSDCSGPPLLLPASPPGPSPLLERVAVGPPRVLLATAGPLESRTVRSRWNPQAVPPLCLTQAEAVSQVFPGRVLTDLGVFTPPFRIE
jgi:hypothetical protein